MTDHDDRSQLIYQPETKVPVGSIDKRRVTAQKSDEKYPIPRAHPVPWQED